MAWAFPCLSGLSGSKWKDHQPPLNDGSLYPRAETSLELLYSFPCPSGLYMLD